MTLEEFLVDVERQEVVGVVAGNGECRLGEVVGTEGSEAIDGVNVIVEACDFVAEGGDDFTGRTRNRDEVTAFHSVAVAAEGTGGFVDRDFGSTDDGRNTPCGGHNGGVGNLRTGGGQNTTGSLHALDIFLARHDGHEDRVFFVGLGGKSFVLREADFTTGSARGSSGTLGDHRGGFAIFGFDLREEEFFESLGIDFADGFFFGEDAFFDEVVGDHGFSFCGSFTVADL